jgi:hypothetical protein
MLRSLFHFDSFGKERTYYLIFAVLILLQLCPIWSTPYPAMHDYPNHLARAHILNEYSNNELYQATYERDWRLIPNLAMDLIVPALMNIVSVETSSKIFLSLVVVVFNLGLHLVGLAINSRPHWNALAATFFTYNFNFSYGFVNYMFGLGLFFITLAVWLRFRSMWTVSRLLCVSAFAMICYVSHLSAVVFLAVSLVCLTWPHVIKPRSFRLEHLIGLLPLVPPTLAYLWFASGIEQKGSAAWWHPLLVKKVTGLLYPFLSYDLVIDLGLGLVFVLLVFLSLKAKGIHFVNWELFLIGGVFVVLYAFAPMTRGGTSYVDRRFLLPAVVFLFLALPIDQSKQLGRYVLIGFLMLPVMRTVEVWYYWNWIGHEVQKQVQVLEYLPEGSRLYPMVVHDQSSPRSWLWDMHFFYTAHYATIYRHAFVPTIYANKTQNTLHLRSADTGYVQTERDTSLDQVKWHSIFIKYDYLYGYNLPEEFKKFLVSKGDLVAQSGETMLFRFTK